jgi:heat shock protein HslJ
MKTSLFFAMLMALVSCKPQPISITNIEWKLVRLNGEDVSVNPPVTLSLDETQKKINGFAGCNRFFGGYELNQSTLKFSGMGSTKMYCQETAATEDQYLKALSEVQSFKSEGEKLQLLADQKIILEFKK